MLGAAIAISTTFRSSSTRQRPSQPICKPLSEFVTRRRAAICGYYGRGNAGDEALLASLLQMLPAHIEPVVFSGNPADTYKRFGTATCPHRSGARILQTLRSCEAFIWGGGSLLQDTTSWASPVYYGGLMALAQQMGLKTIAWAQGVGPLRHAPTRWLARQVLAGCTAASVRDLGTAELLARWNIRALLAPDPVWALEARPVKGIWDLPAPRVAVVLRPHPLLTSARLARLTRALVIFQQATNCCLLLVPFQPQQDLAIAESVASALAGPHQILTRDDPRELFGIFRGVEMAIAMRLHGLIAAATQECRCYALSYDPKVDRLMEELELAGTHLAALPEDANAIALAWLEHYANGMTLDPATLESLGDRALLHRELLHEVLA